MPSVEILFEAVAVAGVESHQKFLEVLLAGQFSHLTPEFTPEDGMYLSR